MELKTAQYVAQQYINTLNSHLPANDGTELTVPVKFKWNNRSNAIGLYEVKTCPVTKRVTERTIYLSKKHTQAHSEDVIINTITHEVAHAIAGIKARHNHEWAAIHKSIGGNGKPCADISDDGMGKVRYKWSVVNTLDGSVVANYSRKPSRDFTRSTLKGKPETLGKLKLVQNY